MLPFLTLIPFRVEERNLSVLFLLDLDILDLLKLGDDVTDFGAKALGNGILEEMEAQAFHDVVDVPRCADILGRDDSGDILCVVSTLEEDLVGLHDLDLIGSQGMDVVATQDGSVLEVDREVSEFHGTFPMSEAELLIAHGYKVRKSPYHVKVHS